ncbi:MAG: hypothetical protein SOR89_05855 [Ndongobacter sp.]|nr:hypothetical protein [Ndongobacter sp.]
MDQEEGVRIKVTFVNELEDADRVLDEGCNIVFGSETEEFDGMQLRKEYIEILDRNGSSVCKKDEVFVGAFGAE